MPIPIRPSIAADHQSIRSRFNSRRHYTCGRRYRCSGSRCRWTSREAPARRVRTRPVAGRLHGRRRTLATGTGAVCARRRPQPRLPQRPKRRPRSRPRRRRLLPSPGRRAWWPTRSGHQERARCRTSSTSRRATTTGLLSNHSWYSCTVSTRRPTAARPRWARSSISASRAYRGRRTGRQSAHSSFSCRRNRWQSHRTATSGPRSSRFLEFAVDRYEIDELRIYLTGINCGAIGVLDYLAEFTGERGRRHRADRKRPV